MFLYKEEYTRKPLNSPSCLPIQMLTLLSRTFRQHNVTVAHRELFFSPVSSDSDLLVSSVLWKNTLITLYPMKDEEDDYRIIFLNVNPTSAREILCEVNLVGNFHIVFAMTSLYITVLFTS